MALEIIERFFAIITFIQCFTTGAAEFAYQRCLLRLAKWAGNHGVVVGIS